MKVKDYFIGSDYIDDKDVGIEYYFASDVSRKRQYSEVRDFEVKEIVKCVEDNKFKLKIHAEGYKEEYEDIARAVEEVTQKQVSELCGKYTACVGCPYQAKDEIKLKDGNTTRCKLKYIAHCVKFNMKCVIECAKGMKGRLD